MDSKMKNIKEQIYLCSYPRSGNTWTRLLLTDIFMQENNLVTTSEIVLKESDDIIPDLHIHNIDITKHSLDLPFYIIKTHKKKDEIYKKIIFLFRQPADALVSYFHYLYGIDKLDSTYKENIDLFVIDYIDKWIEYTESFIESNHKNILYISYEQLHQNPKNTLRSISKFINYSFNEKNIDTAILNQSFENHKGRWKLKEKNGKGGAFFRKGKINSSVEELANETIAIINNKALDLYKKLKNLELSKNNAL